MTNSESGIGILGLGVYLPPIVRKNDFWPSSIVARWRRKLDENTVRAAGDLEHATDGVRAIETAMANLAGDPFQGSRERRIMPDDMKPSDMELRAAKDALARSAIDPATIDLVIGFSFCLDVLNVPNACALHEALGLREGCMVLAMDTACNSFQTQLALAEGMIASGRARNVLLFQSSNLSRLAPIDEPFSAWFGDGATAQVIGRVGPGKGIIGRAHGTDGSLRNALMTGIPGKPWWEEGRIVSYLGDRRQARKMLLTVADTGVHVVGKALADAGVSPRDIDFFACHQATAWFRPVTQAAIGLDRAGALDTFSWAGSLSGANIPLVLATAEREGMLRDGALIATYAGGTGITYASFILRWGSA